MKKQNQEIDRGQIKPWNFVNIYITDEKFDEYVLRTAWLIRPKANKALRNYTDAVFAKNVSVQGFRSGSKGVLSAAFTVVKNSLKKSMFIHADTAAAIVALWAYAEQDLVKSLRQECIRAGILLPSVWTWETAITGFFEMKNIEDILTVIKNIHTYNEEFSEWKYNLAAIWLSGLSLIHI